MTKYLVRGLFVSASLGMSSKVLQHRDWLDAATEDKPPRGEYQSTKGPAWQLSARVMPHFLSSCIKHTFD